MKKFLLFNILTLFIVFPASSQINLSFNVTQPSCDNLFDGAIDMTITGDTLVYTINWYSGGVFISSLEDISNISAGEYIVFVEDSISSTTDTVTITAIAQLTTIDTIADALCHNATGTINITPEDTLVLYTGILYPKAWDAFAQVWYIDSTGIDTLYTNAIDTLQFIWSVPAGLYMVAVYESSGGGCGTSIDIEINEPSAPLTLSKTYEHNICKGIDSAWIAVVPGGGTLPYTYAWNTGDATSGISNLFAGLYEITVRDINGCSIKESIGIGEPFQDLLLIVDTNSVSCRDNQDGYAEINDIENGLAPYTYLWSTGDTDRFIANLDSGLYHVTISDANNCIVTDALHIGLLDRDCIIIHNVITPDGNGKNDVWEIKNIDLYPECDVSVFNRWGQLVYSAENGYDNSWDGTYNGEPLTSGNYYYIVNLNMGNYPPYTGPIKVLK
ncbi:MAG: gliding motility-associated C-terminal domain-containing protein [Flavobacteriales bacterium]|nr:gliding motility-associated C-terminal domain-containing protein [Flavobacteriales bacterium]